MRIQPRRQILDIWRSVVRSSFRDGTWEWRGREESNSISDAEQLLCLLYPATEIEELALDRPDEMAEDVTKTLEKLGEPKMIPQRIIEILEDYLRRYTTDGEPDFGGKGYLSAESGEPTDEQLRLGLVASYSLSVSLCLAALGFLKVYKPPQKRGDKWGDRIKKLQAELNRRLTASMVGLLRSFAVNPIDTGVDDAEVRAAMLAMVNQSNESHRVVVAKLRERLARQRTRLMEDATLSVSDEMVDKLDEDTTLFEIGWAWGIVNGATAVNFVADVEPAKGGFEREPEICSTPGFAAARPYLFTTVLALDGINDIRSTRTQELDLLNEEQRRLSDALALRYELTQRYWSIIARFSDPWPLEDIPWRTSDGEESDYYSLMVSAVLVQDLEGRRADDDDLDRAVTVFESLAQRGRITRRVTKDDASVALHVPGQRMRLEGSAKLGPELLWHASDFAPLLLKRCLQAAALSTRRGSRDRLMDLAETTMDHMITRRIEVSEASGLWDDPGEILFPYDTRPAEKLPSWYMTERVVEALVTASRTFRKEPLRSTAIRARAEEVLHEADQLLNQLLLTSDSDDTSARSVQLTEIERKISRANEILIDRPATANALGQSALRGLDELAVAQDNASRGV
ncbi:hypothetical protein D5S17_17600 [Pseudonocardiaceae bacterium YIM PH 21723]|nr:hypothetical protein D5S17_17600 [Pseudonocardiaceae bacterium YIM PH 21723]